MKMRNCWQSKWHLPRPEKACCCIPLRRGIIALTYYNLVVVIVSLLAFVVEDQFKSFVRLFTTMEEERKLKMARAKSTVISYLVVYLGGILAEIAMVIVVLVGLHKKKLKLIEAYLFYTTVFTILVTFLRVADFHVWMWKFELFIMAFFLVFKIYYILLIRSQYKKMVEKKRKEDKEVEVELEAVKEENDYVWNDSLSFDEENADEWKTPTKSNREETKYLIEDDVVEIT